MIYPLLPPSPISAEYQSRDQIAEQVPGRPSSAEEALSSKGQRMASHHLQNPHFRIHLVNQCEISHYHLTSSIHKFKREESLALPFVPKANSEKIYQSCQSRRLIRDYLLQT